MAINFPNSPAINDLYTFDGRTWIWNGYGWDAVAIGLPTTPGGSDTQIQFNNAGVFGGSANLTWDGSSMLVVGLFRTSTIDPTGFSGSGIDTPGTIGDIGVGSTIEREAGVVGLAFKAAMKAANIDCGCSGRKNDYDARFPY